MTVVLAVLWSAFYALRIGNSQVRNKPEIH